MEKHNHLIPAILSAIIPGVGQIVKGQIVKGVLILVVGIPVSYMLWFTLIFPLWYQTGLLPERMRAAFSQICLRTVMAAACRKTSEDNDPVDPVKEPEVISGEITSNLTLTAD